MQVAPVGAHNLAVAAEQAIRAAEVTHAHPAGIAVVTVAAGHAATRLQGVRPAPDEFVDALSPLIIDGQVQRGVIRARRLLGRSVAEAAYELGNGAQDTVPFAVWPPPSCMTNPPPSPPACRPAAMSTPRVRSLRRRRMHRGRQPSRCPWHPTRLAQPTRTAANVGRSRTAPVRTQERAPVEGAGGTAGLVPLPSSGTGHWPCTDQRSVSQLMHRIRRQPMAQSSTASTAVGFDEGDLVLVEPGADVVAPGVPGERDPAGDDGDLHDAVVELLAHGVPPGMEGRVTAYRGRRSRRCRAGPADLWMTRVRVDQLASPAMICYSPRGRAEIHRSTRAQRAVTARPGETNIQAEPGRQLRKPCSSNMRTYGRGGGAAQALPERPVGPAGYSGLRGRRVWMVEAREGGAPRGKSRWFELPDEDLTTDCARDLISVSGFHGWRDL